MPEKVRVGIAGTSWWADGFLLPSLASEPLAQMAAICGRNEDRARELAAKHQIPQVFTDYRDMIGRAKIDAIVVAGPDDLHCEMTLTAIDAGLHVLCEKPLALSAAQAREMYDRAERAGVKHMTHLELRTWLPTRYVHRLITEGFVGRCLSAEFAYVGSHGRNRDYHWRFDGKRSLGILGDFGPHVIDLARWLVGDISSVCAHLATCYERRGPDGEALDAANDSALLLVGFANGCHGVMNLSAVAHTADRGLEMRVVLHGESGTLELVENDHGYRVYGARHDDRTLSALPIPDDILGGIDPQSPAMQQFLRMLTAHSASCRLFVQSIAADRKISPSFYEGFKAQEVIEAAVESDQNRRFVSV